MSEIPNGRFCWHELMSTEPQKTHDFYGAVIGWTTETWVANGYTMWMNGDYPIGGVMQLPEEAVARGAPSHWLLYISTPDVDATVEKAKGLGATIMTELDIPDVGRIAVIQDPQGAMFAAYQPSGEAPGHDGPPNLGEMSWAELLTTDWQAAWSFYSEMFGWQEDHQMDMGPMGIYHMYNRGAHALGGMMNRPPDMPVNAWLNYFRVADVHEALAKVKANGGQVLNEPIEVPGGDFVAHCIDPTGAVFAVHMVTEGEAASMA